MNAIISDQGLTCLNFDNSFIAHLPGDPKYENSRRQVANACYSRVTPSPVSSTQLVSYSKEVADLLDLSTSTCEKPEFTEVFSGNKLLPDMEPFAMCYGGHQFGSWAGQLGDGRAINLAEVVNKNNQRWTLQLKGAGPTPNMYYETIWHNSQLRRQNGPATNLDVQCFPVVPDSPIAHLKTKKRVSDKKTETR